MTTESGQDEDVRPEVAAFRRLRASGDAALREQLITEWLWLPGFIGKSYHAHGWTQEDLVDQGIVGLIMAIDEYDPDGKHRNTRFHTLASWRIRDELRAISPDISDAPTLVNIPALAPLEAPAWLVGARETTQPLPILREMEQLAAPGPTVEEQVMARVDGVQLSATLEAALLLLSERQRFILERRFGLLKDDPQVWTCEQIGVAIGRHKSSVSRSAQKALAALRAHLATSDDGVLVLHELEQRRNKRRAVKAA